MNSLVATRQLIYKTGEPRYMVPPYRLAVVMNHLTQTGRLSEMRLAVVLHFFLS